MQIYVDADAFPNALKAILYRAVERTRIPALLVACQYVTIPDNPLLRSIEITAGPDAADDHIVELVSAGDLVITADIPLAARVVRKEATAIDPRGTLGGGVTAPCTPADKHTNEYCMILKRMHRQQRQQIMLLIEARQYILHIHAKPMVSSPISCST